jgi:hypothetical protein
VLRVSKENDEQVLYGEIRLKVYAPASEVPATLDDEDPFAGPFAVLTEKLKRLKPEGLSEAEGCSIRVVN